MYTFTKDTFHTEFIVVMVVGGAFLVVILYCTIVQYGGGGEIQAICDGKKPLLDYPHCHIHNLPRGHFTISPQ